MSEKILKRLAFLRIANKEYSYDLFNNGTIFCNTTHHFAKIEDNNVRGDFYETVDYIKKTDNVIQIPKSQDERVKIGSLIATHSINKSIPYGNLYCLKFPLNPENSIKKLDVKCKIDEYCVYIYNVEEFMIRIENALKEKGLKFKQGFVKYWDMRNYEGYKKPFLKDNIYCDQNEYRYFIFCDTNKALKLNIGSIKDIASIEPMIDFNSRMVIY